MVRRAMTYRCIEMCSTKFGKSMLCATLPRKVQQKSRQLAALMACSSARALRRFEELFKSRPPFDGRACRFRASRRSRIRVLRAQGDGASL